eukprot:scaffold345_cov134-Cylindrotheca_fusiformis.AAC.97
MPALSENNTPTHDGLVESISAKINEGAQISEQDLLGVRQLFHSSELPFLDRALLKKADGGTKIVRHLGMIQNMLEPEYYVSQIDDQSFHFRDVPPNQVSDDGTVMEDFTNLAERTPLLVVPIPFTTEWWNQQLRTDQAATSSMANPDATMEVNEGSVPPQNNSRKRERDMQEEKKSKPRMEENQNPNLMDITTDPSEEDPTKEKVAVDWWPSGCCGSEPSQCPVLAKFYYDQYSNEHGRLRLNDVVETIGILSMNPWEADFSSSGIDHELLLDMPPPPSQLARLHVLAYRKVDLDDLASERAVAATTNDEDKSPPAVAAEVHSTVTGLLEQSLAAQALFLTLLSKAERKGDEMQRTSSTAIGCVSLRVSTTLNDSKVLFQHLQSILQGICPVLATVDLTDTTKQYPSPAKTNGRIAPQSWQLPRGATLLIRLGNKTHETLDELLASNQIPYTFDGGMKLPFEGDYRVIVVSNQETVKCTMHVNCDTNLSDLERELLVVRHTISMCRKPGNVKLSEQVLEKAKQDFLAQRSIARSNPKLRMPQEDDFHRWLSMTRLQARARHSESATVEDWERALALDNTIMDSKE